MAAIAGKYGHPHGASTIPILVHLQANREQINLICADFLLSTGSSFGLFWAYKKEVYVGPMCTVQGAIQTIGGSAVFIATILIAVYTFAVIYLRRGPGYRPWHCLAVVAAMWIWAILWAVVPIRVHAGMEPDEHGERSYYVPAPWWCRVNRRYVSNLIVVDHIPMWAAGLGSAILYIAAYFLLWKRHRRDFQLAHDEDERNPFDVRSRSTTSSEGGESPSKLLCYPLVYTACITPLNITWIITTFYGARQLQVVQPLLMFFIVVFYLMGMFNVVLTIWTRPGILLIGSDGELGSNDPRYIAEMGGSVPLNHNVRQEN
ncbi:hypothetical protein FRC08_013933 [Ceratobasidium sp. 394]|nr:hypothetical protein FRC08_013933 [Ceratobasidium sp. 394]KAG9088855.1 hypothetical protein FS749_001808 [Ceratobasidium sp. UAMH 11750]